MNNKLISEITTTGPFRGPIARGQKQTGGQITGRQKFILRPIRGGETNSEPVSQPTSMPAKQAARQPVNQPVGQPARPEIIESERHFFQEGLINM